MEERTLETGYSKKSVEPPGCFDEESFSAQDIIGSKLLSRSDFSGKIRDEPRTTLTSGNLMNSPFIIEIHVVSQIRIISVYNEIEIPNMFQNKSRTENELEHSTFGSRIFETWMISTAFLVEKEVWSSRFNVIWRKTLERFKSCVLHEKVCQD